MRRTTFLLLAALLGGCNSIDRVFEGPQTGDAKIAVGVQSPLNISPGTEQTVTATITRTGQYSGEVMLVVEGVPGGVTATVSAGATASQVSQIAVVIRAEPAAKLGTYLVTLRGKGGGVSDATTPLVINILEAPSFVVTTSQQALTVARGGLAAMAVDLARTNFDAPIALSIQGPAGITMTADANPVAANKARVTILVANDVAPGVYPIVLKGSALGTTDRLVSLSLTVTSDPLQLLAGSDLSLSQSSALTTDIIINRGGYAGAVLLLLEGLPAGATASFQPSSTSGSSATVTLIADASVAVGSYPVVLRGKGAGIPDAMTALTLTVKPAQFSFTVSPQSLSVAPGSSTSASVVIARAGYSDALTITVEGMPVGMTATVQPAVLTGSSAVVAISTASTVPNGTYQLTVRATPAGIPAAAAPATKLNVVVQLPVAAVGNVILNWSTCAAPQWIASQDGNGPWTQLALSSGRAQFAIASVRGGFAYVDGSSLVVRYMSQAELSARAIDMCPPPVGSKSVTGSSVHSTNPTEQFVYQLGGGSATSTYVASNFTISNISDGPQDLVAYGSSVTTLSIRALIRRDVDLPTGSSLGLINMNGTESFPASRAALTIVPTGGSGENYTHTMTYLTTPACVRNQLYTATPTTNPANLMSGVPDGFQRSTDFHLLSVNASTSTRGRSATIAFHTFDAKTVALPPLVTAQSFGAVSGPYKRLQATYASIPVDYNTLATLKYNDGSRTVNVSATMGYLGTAGFTLSTPDLSSASGWSNSFVMAGSAQVSSSITLEGATGPEPLCTEGRRTVSLAQNGVF